jgi:hypothetical protein
LVAYCIAAKYSTPRLFWEGDVSFLFLELTGLVDDFPAQPDQLGPFAFGHWRIGHVRHVDGGRLPDPFIPDPPPQQLVADRQFIPSQPR